MSIFGFKTALILADSEDSDEDLPDDIAEFIFDKEKEEVGKRFEEDKLLGLETALKGRRIEDWRDARLCDFTSLPAAVGEEFDSTEIDLLDREKLEFA
jgi:hypothetical protein